GNKRLGWLAAVVFLDLNGHRPDLDDDTAFSLVMEVAAGAVDVDDIAIRLHVAPRDPETSFSVPAL
ncbi:MAG: death on curing protein, partial [Blastococcus sp.]|nr:death on curing protein [Blastococcus sp.]